VEARRSDPSHGMQIAPNKQKGKVMTAQTSRTGAARKRSGSKQKNKQISPRKKHTSARHNGKDAKLTREPRTLRQTEKQNKRDDAALSKRANGKGRNHHDEQAASQPVTLNHAPAPISERKDRASAIQHPIDGERGRPASSHDPQSIQLKERPDDAIQANEAGLRLTTHASMLPMQALAMAHWQFWSTAMTFYSRAWISASSPSLGRR
jgi:hypothetical protein